MKLINLDLDGKKMNVVETAGNGVVNQDTVFQFSQTENVVNARYAGGLVRRGFLIGKIKQNQLEFKYAQEHEDGKIVGGESLCNISVQQNGKLTLVENFDWEQGRGRNVFQELT
ncbi:MAG: hypothetical protein ABJG78_01165 [Cyclobacteriaceae bacterium]